MRKIYKVEAPNIDGTRYELVGFFGTKAAAEEIAGPKDKAWAMEVTQIPLYDSAEDYRQNNEDTRRKKALAKLTPEEIELLHLK